MITDAERRDEAQILLDAERDKRAAVQLSQIYAEIGIEDSYASHGLVNEAKCSSGPRIIGKIRLTSKAMQASSQIDESDYGVLHDYMVIEDGAKVPLECEPGRVMRSGSFTRPVWAQKGDTLRADFGSLGSISVQFV